MRTFSGRATIALAFAVVVCWCPQPASAAASGLVSGSVWHDRDSDGVRDSGEPGLANVVIAPLGTGHRAVTGSNGQWSLTLPVGSYTLSALNGWLPSACPRDLWCAAGRTKDQRFAVENQFVRAKVSVGASPKTGVNLGLQPDHGDPTGSPTSRSSGNDHGDGPALAHDLAARHSIINWYAGCADPDRTRVCPVGTMLRSLGQIYNQGTATATGIRFVITIPRGTILSQDPVVDVATPGPAPTRTGRRGTTSDGGRWLEFTLNRSLPPAGTVWFTSRYRLTGSPSPKPYGTGRHYDRKGFVSVCATAGGDADSPMRLDPAAGRDAGHSVNWPKAVDDDTSDATEWNAG